MSQISSKYLVLFKLDDGSVMNKLYSSSFRYEFTISSVIAETFPYFLHNLYTIFQSE